jgi:hypothetical protein
MKMKGFSVIPQKEFKSTVEEDETGDKGHTLLKSRRCSSL